MRFIFRAIISSPERQLDRWKKSFFELLNHDPPMRSDRPYGPVALQPFARSASFLTVEFDPVNFPN